jgi:hypothetical protein
MPDEGRRILSPLRLPVSPSGRRAIMDRRTDAGSQVIQLRKRAPDGSPFSVMTGGATRSRTGLDGFAIRCITALLSRQGLRVSHRAASSTGGTQKREAGASLFLRVWSGIRDSNSRPIPWQGIALPTELIPHRTRLSCHLFQGVVSTASSLALYAEKSRRCKSLAAFAVQFQCGRASPDAAAGGATSAAVLVAAAGSATTGSSSGKGVG